MTVKACLFGIIGIMGTLAPLGWSSASEAATMAFGNATDYAQAVGSELFLIDFNSSPGAVVDGSTIHPNVVFGSPEASNPNQVVWNSNALTDAGSTTASNSVGPLRFEFANSVAAFSLLFSSAASPQTVSLYDDSNTLIASLLAPNASGFFGALSDQSIRSVVITPGLFGGSGNLRDRFFIDDLRANNAAQAAVPEPSTVAAGVAGLIWLNSLRRKKQAK